MTAVGLVGVFIAVLAACVALIIGIAELFERGWFGAGMAALASLVVAGLLMAVFFG